MQHWTSRYRHGLSCLCFVFVYAIALIQECETCLWCANLLKLEVASKRVLMTSFTMQIATVPPSHSQAHWRRLECHTSPKWCRRCTGPAHRCSTVRVFLCSKNFWSVLFCCWSRRGNSRRSSWARWVDWLSVYLFFSEQRSSKLWLTYGWSGIIATVYSASIFKSWSQRSLLTIIRLGVRIAAD